MDEPNAVVVDECLLIDRGGAQRVDEPVGVRGESSRAHFLMLLDLGQVAAITATEST